MNERQYLRYVFIDVVGYTRRVLSQQYAIIMTLQDIVKKAVSEYDLPGDFNPEVTYLPTGDGMCIVITRDEFDIHFKVAVKIQQLLYEYNKKANIPFEIRIGCNENEDVVYKDINGNWNCAGRGINLAQRIMSFAEKGQIFVSDVVRERLINHDEYYARFMKFAVTFKGETVIIHQFIDQSCYPYINVYATDEQEKFIV